MVIQIARALGANVFATGSNTDQATIERLGARFIDRAEPVESFVVRLADGSGFDRVYDTVGARDDAFVAVRRFGHVASALGWGKHSLAPPMVPWCHLSGVFTLLPLLTGEGRVHHGTILARATRLAEAGAILPVLDPNRFALDTVDDAYRMIAEETARGKLTIDIEKGAQP